MKTPQELAKEEQKNLKERARVVRVSIDDAVQRAIEAGEFTARDGGIIKCPIRPVDIQLALTYFTESGWGAIEVNLGKTYQFGIKPLKPAYSDQIIK